ncbi:MAG TPA: DUF4349 domain-containing protein [Nocardioidaceae bacterium]|nr:DUF4349 domain-containing protein [Nocardioidaceae bacterium]
MRSTRHSRTRSAVAGAVLGLVALAACGGSSDSEGGSFSEPAAGIADGEVASDRDHGGAVEEKAAAPGTERAPGTANRLYVQTRAVIRTGEIYLVTREMNRARDEIDRLLARHGGYLATEDTVNDRDGRPERSALVLRVPEPSFATVMSELGEIGRTERADRSSEDVTTKVIDVDTRVATQEASLARLQRFLRQATNVEDMIRIESEIATRQAALESLKAQQKYLSDQTSMSTVTVRLRTPAAPPPPPPVHEAGFLVGLAEGWAALKAVLVGAATVTGAVLPFLLTIALVVVALWLLVRAATRRRQSPPPEAPAPEAG